MYVNFMKKFKGKFFKDNLWPTSYIYGPSSSSIYMQNMLTQPKVEKNLEEFHAQTWAIIKFGNLRNNL